MQQEIVTLYNNKQYHRLIELVNDSQLPIQANPMCWVMYLNALRRVGKLDESYSGYKKASKQFKALPFVANGYGNLLIELNKTQEALKVFEHACRLHPNDYNLVLNLARAYDRSGDHLKSTDMFRKAYQLDNKAVDAHLGYATQLMKLNRLDQAEAHYEKIYPTLSHDERIVNGILYCKRKRNKLADATKILAEQLGAVQRSKLLTQAYAGICVLMGQNREAELAYQHAISLAPQDIKLHEEIAKWLWSINDKEPFRFYIANLGQAKDNLALWTSYAQLLISSKSFERASEVVSSLLLLNDVPVSVQLMASNVYRNLSKFDEALQYSSAALSDSLPASLNEHAYNLLAVGQNTQALKLAEKLVNAEPNDQGWWNLYGTCLRACNAYDELAQLRDYNSMVRVSDLGDKLGAAFLADLTDNLLNRHKQVKHPIGQSLSEGSQTLEALFDDQDPVIQSLSEQILQEVEALCANLNHRKGHPLLSRLNNSGEYTYTGSWSVRLKQHGFHYPHFHSQGWISGVIYIQVPNELSQGQGWLEFGRAHINNVNQDAEFAVKPVAGRLVLFPSFVWHGTKRFHSDATRLTVAFDLVPK